MDKSSLDNCFTDMKWGVTRLVAEKQVIESKHQLRPSPADLFIY
jgi:hypothetical protein